MSNHDRECRASVARPLTSSTSGDCPGRKATSGRSMAVVSPASFAERDARAVHSRARGGIHLQKSQERVWPRARPRKRPRRGLVDVLYIDEDARQMRRPASRSNATRRALARALRAVSRDGRHLDPGDAAAIDVPAANRDQATGTRCGMPYSTPIAGQKVSEDHDRQSRWKPKKLRGSSQSVLRDVTVDRTEAGPRAVKHAAARG